MLMLIPTVEKLHTQAQLHAQIKKTKESKDTEESTQAWAGRQISGSKDKETDG